MRGNSALAKQRSLAPLLTSVPDLDMGSFRGNYPFQAIVNLNFCLWTSLRTLVSFHDISLAAIAHASATIVAFFKAKSAQM